MKKAFFIRLRGRLIRTLFLVAVLPPVFLQCRGPLSGEALERVLQVSTVDPMDKIFRETGEFLEAGAVAEVARGEHASFQVALRGAGHIVDLKATIRSFSSGSAEIGDVRTAYVGYVRVSRSTPNPSRDRLLPISGLYPDPLLEVPSVDIRAHQTQPVWITVPVPAETAPGRYRGELVLSGIIDGRKFEVAKELWIQVYDVAVGRTKLWVTNWYNASPNTFAYMNGGQPVETLSETWWRHLEIMARKMAEYRQNVAIISPLSLATYTLKDDGSYGIDFSNFDRSVEIFRDAGVLGRIEGGHIGGREGNWISNFVVSVPVVTDGNTVFRNYPISHDSASTFYRQFFPALHTHLVEKGWWDIYSQHLADEPITENWRSYVEIAQFVKSLVPDILIVEACHTRNLNNVVDIWVPQLNFLHTDYAFYVERMAAGDEVWHYTCLAPQGEYANRFIELPLIKTRILHWINYRYDVPGYLHWGFNFWRGDPFTESTDIQTESGNVLPGGDCWIVYPARDALWSSIRLEAMRDGIVDHTLLDMLEERYPEEARELARQVVYQFDRYDMSVPDFRDKRRKILELLSRN